MKGPKNSAEIDFQKCREKIAASLNEYCNRWCKREHVECDVLKDWKLNIFKIIDRHISFHSQNTYMLPRDHLFGKLLFTWLSLVVSMVMSFCAVLCPTR